jgi:hypothetical protein
VSRAIRISPVLGRPKPPQFPPSGSPRPAKRKADSQEINVIDDSDDQKANQRSVSADTKNEKANGSIQARRPVRRAKRTLRSAHGSNGSGSSQGDEEARPTAKPKVEGGAARRWARRAGSSTQSEEEDSSAAFIIQPDRMEEDTQQSSQPSAASKRTPSPPSSQQQSPPEQQKPANAVDDDSDESDPLFLSFRESQPRGVVVLDLSQQADEDDEETQLGP